MMSDKLDWTKTLGDAVLAQQADVMDAIQRLRSKAAQQAVTTKQQKVSVQQQENKEVISSSKPSPIRSTFPTTIRRRFMVSGPMRTIRRIISAIHPILVPVSLLQGLHLEPAGRSDAGAITGAAAATGVTATSMSITTTGRTTSGTTGSTIRPTARACDTTTPASSRNSATII